MRPVPVTYAVPPGWIYLRELRGDDEESVSDTGTRAAIALIDRLLLDVPGAALGPGQAGRLTAADRDRVLAAIYGHELGDRIASTSVCPHCAAQFDLDFRLSALVASVVEDRDGIERAADGTFALADGTRFRVPSGDDELAASGADDPTLALLQRCRLAGDASAETLAAALERLAPLLDLELEASCPECGRGHAVRFDLQRFFLDRVVAERAQRTFEVHRLARSYGWSLSEIMSLARLRRRDYVELTERELRPR